MTSDQPTRKVVKMFRDAGWSPDKSAGSHTKWRCPTGQHSFALPDGHRTISPGVYAKAVNALDRDTCGEESQQ